MSAHCVTEKDCEMLARSFCYAGFEFAASTLTRATHLYH